LEIIYGVLIAISPPKEASRGSSRSRPAEDGAAQTSVYQG